MNDDDPTQAVARTRRRGGGVVPGRGGDEGPEIQQRRLQPERSESARSLTSDRTSGDASSAAGGAETSPEQGLRSKMRNRVKGLSSRSLNPPPFGAAAPDSKPPASGAAVGAPLKSVFARRRERGSAASRASSRISALSDDLSDCDRSSMPSFTDAKAEWAGGDSGEHSQEQSGDDTISESDEGIRMHSIDEGDVSGKPSLASGDRMCTSSSTATGRCGDTIIGKINGAESCPLRMKSSAPSSTESSSTAASGYQCDNGTGAQINSRVDQYEQRLRAKMEKDSAPTAHRRVVSAMSSELSTASDQYEERLRSKLERGDAKSNGHNQAAKSSDDKYKGRLQAKIEARDVKGTYPKSDSMGSAAAASGMSPASSASESFENRLRAKMGAGNGEARRISSGSMEPGDWSTTAAPPVSPATASDRFEDRLRKKMAQEKNRGDVSAKSPVVAGCIDDSYRSAMTDGGGSAASERYEERLRAKVSNCGSQASPGVLGASHDDRLRKKLERVASNRKMERENVAETTFIAKCAEDGNCNDILLFLRDNPMSSPALVSLALEKIGDVVSTSCGIFDRTCNCEEQAVALNDNWIDVVSVAMSKHRANEAVQLAALRTIWAVVALDSQRALELASSDRGLESLIAAMESHPGVASIQQCGSGIPAYLASDAELASRLLSFKSGAVVDRLGDALQSNSSCALNAFFRLLQACHRSKASPRHLLESIGLCAGTGCQGDEVLGNAMRSVLEVMIDCQDNQTMQIWGCYLLMALFEEETLSGSERGHLFALIDRVGRHLEAVAKMSSTPQAFHEAASCLLSSMLRCAEDTLVEKEVLSRIAVGAMHACPASRVVAMHGSQCISKTVCVNDTVSALLGALNAFADEEVSNIAINAISLLAKEGYKAICTLLEHELLISSLIECMRRHPTSSSIQLAASDVLSRIGLDRHVIGEICSFGGANRLVATLFNCSQVCVVLCKTFGALATLIGICDVDTLRESKAPEGVLCAMKANPTDICVQIQGATTLWNLGSCHPALKREIIQCGGIDRIARAMKDFLASEHMQEKGILALWVLSSSVTLEARVARLAIDSIANAIAAHITNTKVCEHGMGALSLLASAKSVVDDVDTVIDLITCTMWMHSSSAIVQQGGIASLTKLTMDPASDQVMRITSEDLDVIVNSMRTHLCIQGVIENATILLRQFTFGSLNIAVLSQSPLLVGLLKTAVTKFPGGPIQANAESLLQLLPENQ